MVLKGKPRHGSRNSSHAEPDDDSLGVRPLRDLHVTLLHLLGLDDNKLTYFHAGRFKQLSQFGGGVIKELIA